GACPVRRKQAFMKRSAYLIGGLLAGLAISLGVWAWLLNGFYTYQGVVIDPPAPAPDFSLTDQHGADYRLSAHSGKVRLIFFGYTNCPDVCPITLSEFKRIKARLGERAGQVEFIFITVDPERDTVERLEGFMNNFDPSFIGLTGSPEALEQVWKAYGVYHQKQEVGSAAGYLVDHSSRTYAIDAQGRWRINYPFGMEPEKIAEDIAHLLAEQ
ncbi:MAG: SCO family protein, partial [Chloroflexota bacterium]